MKHLFISIILLQENYFVLEDMIKKQVTSSVSPVKSWAKKLGTAFIVGELFAFVGCYSLWREMNISQEFRYTVGQTYYPALDYYYKIGETIDPSSRIRQYDQQIWNRDEPN